MIHTLHLAFFFTSGILIHSQPLFSFFISSSSSLSLPICLSLSGFSVCEVHMYICVYALMYVGPEVDLIHYKL